MTSAPELHATTPRRTVTVAEWLALPAEQRAELIDGRLVYQGMPGPRHGPTQGRLFASLDGAYGRRTAQPDRPGGWWFSQEVDMLLGGIGCRPDLLGWRRDRVPTLPEPDGRGVVTVVPDWICEVLSHSTRSTDFGAKREAYHRAGVASYWLADPRHHTLTVLRHTEAGDLLVLVAGPGERVRVEPFDAVELDLEDLLGADEEPSPTP